MHVEVLHWNLLSLSFNSLGGIAFPRIKLTSLHWLKWVGPWVCLKLLSILVDKANVICMLTLQSCKSLSVCFLVLKVKQGSLSNSIYYLSKVFPYQKYKKDWICKSEGSVPYTCLCTCAWPRALVLESVHGLRSGCYTCTKSFVSCVAQLCIAELSWACGRVFHHVLEFR